MALFPMARRAPLALTIVAVFWVTNARAQEVTLTKEEAEVVKLVLGKDKVMADLSSTQKGLEGLNRLASLQIVGPVKLAIQWNQALFKGWRKANEKVVIIGRDAICKDINLQIAAQSPNQSFFEQLAIARGCDD